MKSPLAAAMMAGAALSLMTAGVTFAQPGPGASRPGAMMRQQDPAEHAKRLREALQLRPDQEPALQAFIASMGQHDGDRQAMRAEREAMANLSTPERLDRMSAQMAEHQQRMAEHIAATKRFYAALTPAQQKAFDAMHNGMKRKGGGRGMGMGERFGG